MDLVVFVLVCRVNPGTNGFFAYVDTAWREDTAVLHRIGRGGRLSACEAQFQ